MSKRFNCHGVNIRDVSTVHKSFSKASGIPADEITPELVADWKRQTAEAMGPLAAMPGFCRLIPIDATYAGCWLGYKMRSLTTDKGERAFDDMRIENIIFNLGRNAVGNYKSSWKNAMTAWNGAKSASKSLSGGEKSASTSAKRAKTDE